MTAMCPLCKQPLAPTDTLSMEWFAPLEWWVLKHTRDGEMWCGQAAPVTQMPELAPFTKAFLESQSRLRGDQ